MTFVVALHSMLKEMHYFFAAASYEYTAAMGVLAILDAIGKREREGRATPHLEHSSYGDRVSARNSFF